jgi:hypothetical protein
VTLQHTRPPTLAPNPITNSSDAIAGQVFRRGIGIVSQYGNASDYIAGQVFRRPVVSGVVLGLTLLQGKLVVGGTLNVGGAATFNSNLTITSPGQLLHTFPSCRAERGAVQAIASGVWTAIDFDAETWDTSTFFAAPSKVMTIPAGLGGLYLINYSFRIDANATGQRQASVALNDSTDTTTGQIDRRSNPTNPAGAAPILGGTTLARLNAGDTVSLKVFQDSGVSLNVASLVGARTYGTTLEIARIGS